MADTIDTSSKVAVAWRSESTRLVALASIMCAFWGRTHAAQPKKISLERAAQLSFLKSRLLRIFVDANWSANMNLPAVPNVLTPRLLAPSDIDSKGESDPNLIDSAQRYLVLYRPWRGDSGDTDVPIVPADILSEFREFSVGTPTTPPTRTTFAAFLMANDENARTFSGCAPCTSLINCSLVIINLIPK
jgi:hypothetical protein